MTPFWPCLVLCCALGATAPIPVDTTLTGVRLHPSEAWITREGGLESGL